MLTTYSRRLLLQCDCKVSDIAGGKVIYNSAAAGVNRFEPTVFDHLPSGDMDYTSGTVTSVVVKHKKTKG